MKALIRLKEIFARSKKHPVTKGSSLSVLARYIYFNIKHRLIGESNYKWIQGLVLPLKLGDAAMVGNYYFYLADFNDSLFAILLLRESDLFVDIGANLGHYSILTSHLSRNKSIAVEPVPSTFNRLNNAIRINRLERLIETYNVGVGNKIEELWFSSEKNNMNRVVDSSYPNAVRVPVTTLDKIVGDKPITLLKIDVEGFEKFVLEGGEKTLSQNSLLGIILELNGSGAKYGIDEEEIHINLVSKGFNPYHFNGENRELKLLNSYSKTSFNTLYLKNIDDIKDRLISNEVVKVGNKCF